MTKYVLKYVMFIILLTFIVNVNIYAQTTSPYLRASNPVVFFLYEDKDVDFTFKRVSFAGYNVDLEDQPHKFYFKFENPSTKQLESLLLYYDKLLNLPNYTPALFKVHKSFIRKNKDLFYTVDDFKKMGYNKTFNLLNKAKTIF